MDGVEELSVSSNLRVIELPEEATDEVNTGALISVRLKLVDL